MRRVEAGTPFRAAYREVAAEAARGAAFPAPGADEILARRTSLGSPGNPGLEILRARLTACRRWVASERRRFDRAMRRLAGGATPRGRGRPRRTRGARRRR